MMSVEEKRVQYSSKSEFYYDLFFEKDVKISEILEEIDIAADKGMDIIRSIGTIENFVDECQKKGIIEIE